MRPLPTPLLPPLKLLPPTKLSRAHNRVMFKTLTLGTWFPGLARYFPTHTISYGIFRACRR